MKNPLTQSLENSPFAWWEWNPQSNELLINDLKARMLGYDPKDFQGKGFQVFTDLVHPEDFESTMDAMRDLLAGRSPLYQTTYRIKAITGSYHFYLDRGIVLQRDASGQPALIRGIVIDLGQEIGSDHGLGALLDILENSRQTYNPELGSALVVCSNCKKVKRHNLDWIPLSDNLVHLIATQVSHSICPPCVKALYPEFYPQFKAKFGL